MERDEIERPDFPSARRGYDPAAVDAHLRRVADEFDALGASAAARPRDASLAAGTSAQVRAILEAAEAGATAVREQAGRDARGHVERVEDATQGMLQKLDRLQAELDRLLSGLKATAETLADSLGELSRDVGTVGGGPEPEPEPEPAPQAPERSDDEAGARLVALNMALEGTSRDEAARFLAEHYRLADAAALLDDVYSSAGR